MYLGAPIPITDFLGRSAAVMKESAIEYATTNHVLDSLIMLKERLASIQFCSKQKAHKAPAVLATQGAGRFKDSYVIRIA